MTKFQACSEIIRPIKIGIMHPAQEGGQEAEYDMTYANIICEYREFDWDVRLDGGGTWYIKVGDKFIFDDTTWTVTKILEGGV